MTEQQETENRDTFLQRLLTPPGSVIFSDEERSRILLAYDMAKYAHRAQDRKDGTRYFEHPRKVALRLIDVFGLYHAAAVIAALLHDGYEDCPKYVTPMTVQIIGGDECSRMIRFLSKVPKEGRRELIQMRWGLVPLWAKDLSMGTRRINARAESLERKPAFREAFRQRRCLVPTDGFYEWEKKGKVRQPWRIGPAEDGLMALASGKGRVRFTLWVSVSTEVRTLSVTVKV